jgi:hypothetical protein
LTTELAFGKVTLSVPPIEGAAMAEEHGALPEVRKE